VIFVIQEKVTANGSCAHGHEDKDDEHESHKSVDIVNFVVPEGRENKVNFDKNSAIGNNSRGQD